MNPAQPRIVTLKASSQHRKLRQRLHLAPTIAARRFTFPVRNPLGWYTLQQHCLTWFEVIGYTVLLQSDIGCVRHPAQRYSNSEVILRDRLLKALQRINPTIPLSAIAKTISELTVKNNCLLIENNHCCHQLLTNGIIAFLRLVEYAYNLDCKIKSEHLLKYKNETIFPRLSPKNI
ncbi:putative type I restriction system endonuclease [Nostoc carneum NIES-2107]|nr:putative type I restriction system endonuclease [Nostoc carneum NIES-2107]